MMGLLSENVKITQIVAPTTTATTTVTSATVDMANYEGVLIIASTGSAAADIGIKIRQATASNMSGAADLAGTLLNSDGTKKQWVLDLHRPAERYIDVQVIRTTTTTIDSVWAIQYGNRSGPISQVTAAIQTEVSKSPAEGTA